VRKISDSIPGWVKSKTEKLTIVASLVSVQHLRTGWPGVRLK